MPPDQTQLNSERIDALAELIEQANVGPPEHVAALRDVEEIGEAAAVAEAHRNGEPPGNQGGQS